MTQQSTSRRGHLGMRVALISLGVTGLGIAATAGTSAAHNPNAVASCTDLKVSFDTYEGPANNNKLTITINGVSTSTTFGETFSETIPWDGSIDHTWSVAVDANTVNGDATPYDWSTNGTEHACTPTSSTTPATSTTAPPTSSTTPPSTAPPTTAPATTAPPTTVPAFVTPTTAPPAVTTTTAVASEAPVAPPTTAAASSGGATLVAPKTSALPATGSNTGVQLTLAMAVLMAGFGLVTITRRRANRAGRQS